LLVSNGIHDGVPIETGGRLALMNPNAVLLQHGGLLLNGPQRQAFSMFFQAKLGAFAELEAIAKGLGENDATGFVDLESHGIYNGIWHC